MASQDLILEMLRNPPDLNEPQPVPNRRETIFGSLISFKILACFAVFLRLYTRFVSVRKSWWDDFFVVLAFLMSVTGGVAVLLADDRGGLGRHFLSLDSEQRRNYLLFFYISNGTYVTNTALIKISLLFQYLRIFRTGTLRWICLFLLALITLWGLVYSFLAWVPCFPVQGFWDRDLQPKCYGYGFSDISSFAITFETHTALNMAFDLAVFLTPLVLYREPELRLRKQLWALTGLFSVGAVVVFISVWRLFTIVESKAATLPYIDFTWNAPVPIILSCLEIDLAIICASMPIFWPVLSKSLAQIIVLTEVRITEHRRLSRGGEYELEHSGRDGSIKSVSGGSETELTRTMSKREVNEHYRDRYVIEQVDPLSQGVGLAQTGVETNIVGRKKSNWSLRGP